MTANPPNSLARLVQAAWEAVLPINEIIGMGIDENFHPPRFDFPYILDAFAPADTVPADKPGDLDVFVLEVDQPPTVEPRRSDRMICGAASIAGAESRVRTPILFLLFASDRVTFLRGKLENINGQRRLYKFDGTGWGSPVWTETFP
jgi:hypothetical protein